ncbi:MAG: L,D-transpeptidase [Devosiaceae bacterium]
MDTGIWASKVLLGIGALAMAAGITAGDAKAQSVSHHAGSPYVMLHQERASPWLLQLQPGYARQQHHMRQQQAQQPRHQRSLSGRIVTRPTQGHVRQHPGPAQVQQASVAPSHQLNPIFLPQVVSYDTHHPVGTIIVDPHNKFLYLVEAGGQARRYGVGVGRQGFGWSGTASVQRRAEWPRWTPPASMIEREPHLEEWRHGMPGGIENPLGARALYLYQGGRDTLYRIHGTNQPWTIGQSMSSGCIRMRNEDVSDLYERVRIGARVVVL